MKIEHIAIWAADLERLREFYCTYFEAVSGQKYSNAQKGFTSYFLSFAEEQTRLELMHRDDIALTMLTRGFSTGIAHFAISVGGREAVNQLTERLRRDKFTIASEPRTTGDGYYESAVLDPEGNYIEIFA